MRLDKYIADTGIASRKEIARAARSGLVLLNGKAAKDPSVHINENVDEVIYCGSKVNWRKYVYIMLNKPSGYVSTTDPIDNSVMKLLGPEHTKMEMFPCGRLDIDTVGLLLITNDGPTAHELLAPRHHVDKTYFFRCDPPIDESAADKLREGVDIGGYVTKPASLVCRGSEGELTIREGKFHQIKRMLEAVGSKITYLRRMTFGPLKLDESLAEGEWRELTDSEIKSLLNKD